MSHALSHRTSEEFSKLADLLEQASHLARKLSHGIDVSKTMSLSIPELKHPKHVPKDQEWFWTKEWQAGEREANEAFLRGDYVEFDNVHDAIVELHRHL